MEGVMRIGLPTDCIPAQVPPSRRQTVDVTPLPPEKAKELIGLGFFKQDPNKVLWTLTGGAAIATGKTAQAIKAVPLSGGLQIQAWTTARPDGLLLTTLLEAGTQAMPILEQAGAGSEGVAAVADGMAVLMATPQMLHAWVDPRRWSIKNIFLYGVNLLRAAGIANQFLHIPHVDTPLQVATMIFKCGDEVFVASKPKGAAA
jgi:hypothetical protein